MIILAKFLSIILGGLVISKTILDYRKKNESIIMTGFWVTTWLAIVILALYPILVEKIASVTGEHGNSLSSFMGVVFVFLFFVTYRVYVKTQRIERQLRDLVMKVGLKDMEV